MSAFYKVMYAQDMMFGGPRVDAGATETEGKKVEIEFAIGGDESSDEKEKDGAGDPVKKESTKDVKTVGGERSGEMKATRRERSRSQEKEGRTQKDAAVEGQPVAKGHVVDEISREEKIRLARERLKQRHTKPEVFIDGDDHRAQKGDHKV
jgi:hypothetical protein